MCAVFLRDESPGPGGGIGRRTTLRWWRRKAWGFESPLGHQSTNARQANIRIARFSFVERDDRGALRDAIHSRLSACGLLHAPVHAKIPWLTRTESNAQ